MLMFMGINKAFSCLWLFHSFSGS